LDYYGEIKGNNIFEMKKILKQFGWKDENLPDLGDITGARASESVLVIWLRVMGVLNTPAFNFRIIR
jgi:8-hydroxy-5-deazaflavin:NADPH oxidoreductase